MAIRVAALLAGAVLLPALSWGGLAARSGIAEALQGRWERASDRLRALPSSAERGERYFLATALAELGQKEEALSHFRELSGTAGPFGGPALEAALSLLFEGERFGEVSSVFEETRADRFQDEARLRYQAGQSYFLLRLYPKAKSQLEKVTDGPFLSYALYTRAQIAQAEGRLLDAVELLGNAVAPSAGVGDALVGAALADKIRVTRGRMIYQAAVGQKNLPSADRRKLFDLALAQFSRVNGQSPLYADALRGIGWCAVETGDSAKALGAFEQASDVDPSGRHEDLWAQGRVYQSLGYFEEAAKAYGEAREAASGEPAETASVETVGRSWRILLEGVGRSKSRLATVAAEEKRVTSALEGRGRRVAVSKERLSALATSSAVHLAELVDLEKNLERYLDAASASALFPLSERPRLEGVLARQDRVLRELTTLEEVLVRLTGSGAWKGAREESKSTAQRLWDRLGTAKASLSQSQLAFLEGLKGRVSAREEELARGIERRRAEVESVEPGRARGLRIMDGEQQRLAAAGTRLKELSRRREAASQRLDALEARIRGERDDAMARGAEEQRTRLRLKADAYTLDETEALHLWEERGRGAEKGGGR